MACVASLQGSAHSCPILLPTQPWLISCAILSIPCPAPIQAVPMLISSTSVVSTIAYSTSLKALFPGCQKNPHLVSQGSDVEEKEYNRSNSPAVAGLSCKPTSGSRYMPNRAPSQNAGIRPSLANQNGQLLSPTLDKRRHGNWNFSCGCVQTSWRGRGRSSARATSLTEEAVVREQRLKVIDSIPHFV